MAVLPGHESDCGCCAGIDSETPGRVRNPPGQPEVAYRVGTHSRFKESMLARLSSSAYPALGALGTRDDSDFTIALCDALASSLDVLTFYQERTANENYLRTALEDYSVFGMARLIGYAPAPGVAAATHLAFRLQEAPGTTAEAAGPVTIPRGTRVQSVPGPDEEPQSFETAEPTDARSEWNAVPLQRTAPWAPVFGDTDLYLDGVATQLEPGDAILLVGEARLLLAGSERWDVRVLDAVEADTGSERTRVRWEEGLGHVSPLVNPASQAVQVFAFRQRAALFGNNAPDPHLMSTEGSNIGDLINAGPPVTWKNYQIGSTSFDLDSAYPKVTAGSFIALVSNEAGRGSGSLPGYVELYRADRVNQVSRTDFGLSGRTTRIIPDTTENLTRFTLPETLALVQSEELLPVERPLLYPVYGDTISLQHRVEGLAAGRPLSISGKRQRLVVAPGVNDLELALDEGGTLALDEGDSLVLEGSPVERVGSVSSYLPPDAFGEKLGDASVTLELALMDRDGRTGTLIAKGSEIQMDASRKDDPVVAEVVFIGSTADAVTSDRDRTALRLVTPLANAYERATASMNANVAPATHGETVEEIVGSGDASRVDQAFVLRQSPLTYVSADSASGRASTLAMRVNDVLFAEVPTLFGRDADERVYTVSSDEEGNATVRFGDGVEGARLPTGQNNLRAAYRKGIGTGGNVRAGTLSNLLSRPLGVSEATNPEAATGGEDRESLSRARQNAPLTVLTLDRAVSILDYANFARAFAGIDKAHALWLPAGPTRGVFITVAGVDGAAVPSDGNTYQNLLSALHTYGDPLIPLRLVDYRPALFALQMGVKVGPVHDAEVVLSAVREMLVSRFGFAPREFGQGTSLDEVVAVAHEVAGVEAVRVAHLYRPGPGVDPSAEARLRAALPIASLTDTPEAAELLTIDPEMLVVEMMP